MADFRFRFRNTLLAAPFCAACSLALVTSHVAAQGNTAQLTPSFDAFTRQHEAPSAPSLTLRMTKRAIYQGMRNDLRTNLDLISSHYAIITASQEHKDLVNKFIAERGKKLQ